MGKLMGEYFDFLFNLFDNSQDNIKKVIYVTTAITEAVIWLSEHAIFSEAMLIMLINKEPHWCETEHLLIT